MRSGCFGAPAFRCTTLCIQIGEVKLARQHAEWLLAHTGRHLDTGSRLDWWPNAYRACSLEVLGEREQALHYIERIPDSSGLIWMPLLLDLHCFRRLGSEPRYQAAVAALEERTAELRARVPDPTRARLDAARPWRSANRG
jgi:hypothetical protein